MDKTCRMGIIVVGKKVLFTVERNCVRSVMLCGSETRCLRENEVAILKN